MNQTPKIKRVVVCFILGVVMSVSVFFLINSSGSKYVKVQTNKLVQNAFYAPLKVEMFTEGKIPCFNVEIENNKLLFRLDLGSNGEITILEEFLQKIKEKSFLTTQSSCGMKGNIYTIDVYKIPKMKMGSITFSPVKMSQENLNFNEESLLNIQKDSSLPVVAGTIGWKIFNQTALLLDLGSSMIAVCDSIGTFVNQGYSLEKFTKIPMIDDSQLIEFDTVTAQGPLRCMLDTGCTINFLNSNNVQGESFSQMIQEEKNYTKFSSLKMNKTEFGPIEFCKIPIQLPCQIEAILSMDFLKDHIVLIDFNNRQIYLSKKWNMRRIRMQLLEWYKGSVASSL